MALYTVTDTDLTSIADAIREKSGSSEPLSFPGGFTDAIDAIPTGGGGGDTKNLVFIDYDGTEVSSYTTAEALALASLPANPTHDGLTAQGWNWSLAGIKSYLTDYPDAVVNVGQMYITDDSKTRIYITLDDPDALSPYLAIAINGTVSVDWGDGSAHDTMTGSSTSTLVYCRHAYGNVGDYIISIEVVSGRFAFYARGTGYTSCLVVGNLSNERDRSRLYSKAITKVNVGNNADIGSLAFANCNSLSSVTIPNSVTSIEGYAFFYCNSLSSVTIPSGVTSILNSIFANCYSLSSVTIPNGVTSISNNVFQNCYQLSSVTIPDGVTRIESNMFANCYSLSSVTIPDSVTNIGSSMFYNCYSLSSVTIPDSVTSIESSAFMNCYFLSSVTIPDSVTSIGNGAFQNCNSLSSVTIPDGVTSIGNNAFYNCYSLSSVTIPDSVTSIGSSTFSSCYGMLDYHFRSTTPPALANTNAFSNIISGTIIYVPYSADHSILEAYKTAANWSTYASRMQEEPQQ